MDTYLRATGREAIADLANKNIDLLTQDNEIEKEIEENPENALKYFDQLIEINLSNLEPYIVGPHTPDLARPISKMAEDVKKNNYLDTISVSLIGSAQILLMRICQEQRILQSRQKKEELEQKYHYKLRLVLKWLELLLKEMDKCKF